MRHILAAALLAVTVSGCASAPPPVSEKVQKYYEENKNLVAAVDKPVAVFLGDSYTAGSHNAVTWPDIVAGQQHWDYTNVAAGGSGYSNTEGNSLAAQLKNIEVTPDLIIVAGSRNDTYTPENVEPAATDLYAKLKKRAPKARIIVIGPMWDNTTPAAGAVAADAAVNAAAAKSGLTFIDPLPENWLGKKSLIQSDGVHPSDAGQQVLAERIGQKLKGLGL